MPATAVFHSSDLRASLPPKARGSPKAGASRLWPFVRSLVLKHEVVRARNAELFVKLAASSRCAW